MPQFIDNQETWTTGWWRSNLLDVSLFAFSDGVNEWGQLTWTEENTSDESRAYVRLDIYSSSGSLIASDIASDGNGNSRSINLGDYVLSSDCYVEFKLYALDISPVISDIVLKPNREW